MPPRCLARPARRCLDLPGRCPGHPACSDGSPQGTTATKMPASPGDTSRVPSEEEPPAAQDALLQAVAAPGFARGTGVVVERAEPVGPGGIDVEHFPP